MELRNVLLVGAALAALGFAGCSAEEGDDEPEFRLQDFQLEMCVRDTIKNYETPLTVEEAMGIRELECQDYQIASLEGIQWFHGLRELYLWENQITDITPLGSLPALEWLELGDNQISDISPLSVMPYLSRLGLSHNNITDVSPLAGMTSLRWLNLDGNGLTDDAVPHLLTLTELTWLTVEHNQIGNAAELSGFPNCEVYRTYQDTANRSARPSGEGLPRRLFPPPRATGVAPMGKLAAEVLDDGRIAFTYDTGETHYPIMQEFAGDVYADGTTLLYRSNEGEIAVGELGAEGVQLCSGAYADVCSAAVGKKGPWDGSRPVRGGADPKPIFSLALDVRALDASRLRSDVRYGSRNDELLDYVLASPNQYDAASCIFMATTGAMELLMNQHVGLAARQYKGDTDLSERYLMNAFDDNVYSHMRYWLTDLAYTYELKGGALLDRDYPFVYDADDGAYYNWEDDRPANWQDLLVPTPKVDRTPIYVDQAYDVETYWDVLKMNPDHVARIKYELLSKRAPVVIIYNHVGYWHSDLIVGYDDNAASQGCPFVQASISTMRDRGYTSTADSIESRIARDGGCTENGIFYVRDSIYDGTSEEPTYDYGSFSGKYSDRIRTLSYNWVRYLANHAFVLYRQ